VQGLGLLTGGTLSFEYFVIIGVWVMGGKAQPKISHLQVLSIPQQIAGPLYGITTTVKINPTPIP